MKEKKTKKATALGAFVIVGAIVAIVAAVVLILHNSYGLLQF